MLPSQRVVFMIDCPTSRTKIPLAALSSIHEMIGKHENFSLLVQCGGRLDYLAAIQNKMQQLWPGGQIFVSVVNNGSEAQSTRRRSKFALVLHMGKLQPAVPSQVPALRGKAKSYEGLRQRCLSLQCKLRSEEEQAKAQSLKDQAEMDPNLAAALARCEISQDDDEEKVPLDAAQSEDECDLVAEGGEGEGVRDFITDIFTFSHSTSYCEACYQSLLSSANAVVAVVMTSTCHPASAVAARLLGQEVFVHTFHASEHCVAHGIELQDVIFQARFLERNGGGAAKQKRQSPTSGIQVIQGPKMTPQQQIVRLFEAAWFKTKYVNLVGQVCFK